jgi:ferredoxin
VADFSITVDRNLCTSAGVCVVYAPNTFAQDDEGKSVVLDGELDDIDTVQAAVEACPMQALAIVPAAG